MELSEFTSSHSTEVIDLFTSVFSDSEGEEEGRIIGHLVSNLIETTSAQDLMGFIAKSNGRIVGCIFFSRFIVPNNQVAFMLSPVAISTGKQGAGIGKKLISYGLEHLKSTHTDLVFTYGDPNYYSKVGFKPISESVVSAPFHLTRPEGWLAQSLDGGTINPMQGVTQCVEAFNDPVHW